MGKAKKGKRKMIAALTPPVAQVMGPSWMDRAGRCKRTLAAPTMNESPASDSKKMVP
jgi:hypothetical protein